MQHIAQHAQQATAQHSTAHNVQDSAAQHSTAQVLHSTAPCSTLPAQRSAAERSTTQQGTRLQLDGADQAVDAVLLGGGFHQVTLALAGLRGAAQQLGGL